MSSPSRQSFDYLQSAAIRSKHGVILACVLACPAAGPVVKDRLTQLASRLTGQKYAFVDEDALELKKSDDGVLRDVWTWLKTEMDH